MLPLRAPNLALHHASIGTDSGPVNFLNPPPIAIHDRFVGVCVDIEGIAEAGCLVHVESVPHVIAKHDQPVPVGFESMAHNVSVDIVFRNGLHGPIQHQLNAVGDLLVAIVLGHVNFVHVQ